MFTKLPSLLEKIGLSCSLTSKCSDRAGLERRMNQQRKPRAERSFYRKGYSGNSVGSFVETVQHFSFVCAAFC